jgi:taurine--2-oxoglutarate transaminase
MDLDELVFHPWTMQGPRAVLNIRGGSGSYVIDAGGRQYLDFGSQLVFANLGHHSARSRVIGSRPRGFFRFVASFFPGGT